MGSNGRYCTPFPVVPVAYVDPVALRVFFAIDDLRKAPETENENSGAAATPRDLSALSAAESVVVAKAELISLFSVFLMSLIPSTVAAVLTV